MNKKRIICLALALVMVLGIFAGCGSILSAWPFGDSSSSSSSSAVRTLITANTWMSRDFLKR